MKKLFWDEKSPKLCDFWLLFGYWQLAFATVWKANEMKKKKDLTTKYDDIDHRR